MLIQTTEEILDYQGQPFPLTQGSSQMTTVRDVVQMALNNPTPNETQSKEQKADLFRLTQLFYSDVMVEVSQKDADLIQERAWELLNALVCGRLAEIFARQAQLVNSNGHRKAPEPYIKFESENETANDHSRKIVESAVGEPNGDG